MLGIKIAKSGIQCGVEEAPPDLLSLRNRRIMEQTNFADGTFFMGGKQCMELGCELIELLRHLSRCSSGHSDWSNFVQREITGTVQKFADLTSGIRTSDGGNFTRYDASYVDDSLNSALSAALGALCTIGGSGYDLPRKGGDCTVSSESRPVFPSNGIVYGIVIKN